MLGEKIKKYREEKKITQVEVAEVLGVKPATVSKYEAGTLEPNIESLKKLAELFEISVDELLREDEFDVSKINILEVYIIILKLYLHIIQIILKEVSLQKIRLDIFMKLILY